MPSGEWRMMKRVGGESWLRGIGSSIPASDWLMISGEASAFFGSCLRERGIFNVLGCGNYCKTSKFLVTFLLGGGVRGQQPRRLY